MTMLKKVQLVMEDDGFTVINLDSTEADADWLRAARLKKRADAGDEAAKLEFERMGRTPMFERVRIR
jgi:hypothetical protein